MVPFYKYLTVAEANVVTSARMRPDDDQVNDLIAIIERLQAEVDHRAQLRPVRDPDDSDLFLLAAANVYPPEETAENVSPAVTFVRLDDRLKNHAAGSRQFFETSIAVPMDNSEIARIVFDPKSQAHPTEEDADPPYENDDTRQHVVFRVTFEDGCPTLRSVMATGEFDSTRLAGFTAEMRHSEIILRFNGTTHVIVATQRDK